MKISFAICTHNEGYYITNLLRRLTTFIKGPAKLLSTEFEIVVVDDFSTDSHTLAALTTFENDIFLHFHELNGDFATHKNFMNACCSGDWILNLDADEWLPEDVLFNLASIIEWNPTLDAYWFARVNTVDGLTQAHLTRWNWIITTLPGFRAAAMRETISNEEYALLQGHNLIVSENDGVVNYDRPIVAWPDPQCRLYRNIPDIRWTGKVHERLTGIRQYTHFPIDPEFAIRHEKDIRRQEQQNNFYDQLNSSR